MKPRATLFSVLILKRGTYMRTGRRAAVDMALFRGAWQRLGAASGMAVMGTVTHHT